MRIWTKRLAYLLGFYSLLRVQFLLFHWDSLAAVSTQDIVLAFVEGLRFDIAAIVTVNAGIVILHQVRQLFDSRRTKILFDDWIGLLFYAVNIPFLVVGIVDTKLFTFTGRRTTPDFFGIAGDIGGQGVSIAMQYWWITLGGFLACWVFIWLTWQRHHDTPLRISHRTKFQQAGVLIGAAALAVLAARGGLQRKPLAPAHAYVYQPPVLANLVLNSSITLLRSSPSNAIQHYHDFETMEDVRQTLTPPNPIGLQRVPMAPGKNIVILIVESLATEYVGSLNKGQGYTPFLDSLFERSVTFTESFANGRRSIDAMPSIFAAIPAWRDQPYVTSTFSGNEIQALPRLLKVQGYETYFFHGAANGSMHFDVFSAIAGINRYLGRDQYTKTGDHDGTWGIYDEPFLQFAAETLNRETKPFMAGIFTLSSHNPFSIPQQYAGKFPKGTLPIHESIGYVDESIRKFFATAEKMPWYKNTIFVITGDHTSLTDRPGYDNPIGRFRVPIAFFDPTGNLPSIGKSKMAHHTDITPTLLDILGLTPQKPSLNGWSLFDPAFQGRFIQYEYGNWTYFDRDALLRLDDGDKLQGFQRGDFTLLTPFPVTLPDSRVQVLKAARQYYINGMIDNSWHK